MPDLDLNAPEKGESREKGKGGKREKRDKDRREAEPGFERIALNVGKAQGFFPGNLMEMINRNVSSNKPEIGRIDLMPDYTLFDVRKSEAKKVIDALRNEDFFGTILKPEIATDRDYSSGSKTKGRKKSSSSKNKVDGGKKKQKETAKKSKSSKKKDYNGNYEIFYKKKK